jgi:oligoribonuclease NrnB/cAMP/cGMP phosphodiesterase (DHH superfamily)
MDKHVIIYHANCADGFGAAWAASKALTGDKVFVPANYGDELPAEVDGAHVYVLDFSFSTDKMLELYSRCQTLVWLDHHKTAAVIADDFKATLEDAGEAGLPDLVVEFDMDRSGAGIAWDYFHPMTPRPPLIDYIEDRDLWRFRFAGTRAFGFALRSYPMDFGVWDEIADDSARVLEEGAAMMRFFDQSLADTLKSTKHEVTLAGVKGLAANMNSMFASDAGNVLAKESGTFGLTYYRVGDGPWACSLRSVGDFDVSAIAQQFGGGGHKNAAGFSCDKPVWSRK